MKYDNIQKGAGFFDLLLVAFIVMKLCGVITWSWWWVLSPFWIPLGIVLLILSYTVFVMSMK